VILVFPENFKNPKKAWIHLNDFFSNKKILKPKKDLDSLKRFYFFK